MSIIENIVGRYHVNTPTEKVVAAVMRKVKPAARKAMTAEHRTALETRIRKAHEDNRALYTSVMGGI